MLVVRLLIVFVVGACLGSLANWAIYALAWRPRAISPWSRPAADSGPRRRSDRLPIIGWLALRRLSTVHGPRFWWRPLLIEIAFGVGLAALYWWEVGRLGLIAGQVGLALEPPTWPVHWQFASHAILLCWMLAASFIDIDEKIIPDAITVSGTLVGLALATLAPMSLLPHVAERPATTIFSYALRAADGGPAIGPQGDPLWLEPVTVVSPRPWQAARGIVTGFPALAIGLGCYWLWCFALAPRIWRGRRGAGFALRLIASRVGREFNRPPLRWLLGFGTLAIVCVWALHAQAWAGLFTALVGLVASGGMVWSVRIIGTAALRREAMGFGDVTLMMMIGTFLGWQACLITFFLAPFAGLLIGLAQLISRRDDEIPYGPFLCLGAAAVVVLWAPIWLWAQRNWLIGPAWLVPAVLVLGVLLLGIALAVWRMIKIALFGRTA
jgi:prepilin signal peptidase PulO-like enzyme (type II secretory pathway)